MRTLTLFAAAAGLLAAAGAAQAASPTFITIDNPGDPTFNQLLGINNKGVISGYFGSGQAGHPNQAYTIAPPYINFVPANLPGSTQTQATGINGAGTITGFWSSSNTGTDPNFGFIRWNNHGSFRYLSVNDPLVTSVPPVTQVLGINKSELAVGFYNDSAGASHGFVYTVATGAFTPIMVGGSVSDAATGINNNNLICGFFVNDKGVTHAFLEPLTGGTAIRFGVPHASVTQFLGVNSLGKAVGFYQDVNNITHGLVYNPANGAWQTLDDPNGVGGTVLNGLNDKGQIVGFFTDAAGNVHGMLVNGAP